MSEPILNINHLRKNFGKNEVLKDYLDRIFAFLETEPAGQ